MLAHLVEAFGPAAGVVGFYLRLSGLPVPIAEHALPVYLGHRYASSPPALVSAWLGLIALSVAGTSNLYLLGRWWGRSRATGAVASVLRLAPGHVAWVEGWYRRWGWAAVMVGSHVPGVRVPVLISAGALSVRYPAFVLSIAATMAPRLALLLLLGVNFGSQLADFLTRHPSMYIALSAVVALALIGAIWRLWNGVQGRPAETPAD